MSFYVSEKDGVYQVDIKDGSGNVACCVGGLEWGDSHSAMFFATALNAVVVGFAKSEGKQPEGAYGYLAPLRD